MVFGLLAGTGGSSSSNVKDELFCVTEERNYFQAKYLEQVSEIVALKEQLKKSQNEILRLRSEVMEHNTLRQQIMLNMTSAEQQQQQLLLQTGEDDDDEEEEDANSNNQSSSQVLVSPQVREGDDSELKMESACASAYQTPSKGDKSRRRLRNCSSEKEEKKIDDAQTISDNEEEEEEEYDDEDDNQDKTETLDEEDKDIRQSAEKLLQWATYRSSYTRSSSAILDDRNGGTASSSTSSPVSSPALVAASSPSSERQ